MKPLTSIDTEPPPDPTDTLPLEQRERVIALRAAKDLLRAGYIGGANEPWKLTYLADYILHGTTDPGPEDYPDDDPDSLTDPRDDPDRAYDEWREDRRGPRP